MTRGNTSDSLRSYERVKNKQSLSMQQIKKRTFNKQIAAQHKISADISSIHTDFGPSGGDSSIGIKLSISAVSENRLDNIDDTSIKESIDTLNKPIVETSPRKEGEDNPIESIQQK